jgi:hypothetical protein
MPFRRTNRTPFSRWVCKLQRKWFLNITELCCKMLRLLNLQQHHPCLMRSNLTSPRSNSSCINCELICVQSNFILRVPWMVTPTNQLLWIWDYNPRSFSNNSTTSTNSSLKRTWSAIVRPCLNAAATLNLTQSTKDYKQNQAQQGSRCRQIYKKKEIRPNIKLLRQSIPLLLIREVLLDNKERRSIFLRTPHTLLGLFCGRSSTSKSRSTSL